MSKFKQYLGDSVYADFDGHGIWLTTENGGASPNNQIFLDGSVLQNFDQYRKWLLEQRGETEQ